MNDPAVAGPAVPSVAAQETFWNEWNSSHLASSRRDSFQLQQRDVATAAVVRAAAALEERRPLRILDFGCGTGWLGASLTSYGDVTGIDLSSTAIEHGRTQFPDVDLLAGNFADVRLTGLFDVVISSDVIAHVVDQQAYIQRVADLLRPGGTFVLMTQNGFVWRRSSQLQPQGRGQIRNWPSLKVLRKMLKRDFVVVRVRSIQPAGDRGILWLLNGRWIRGGFKLLRLGDAWKVFLERILIGRDFTIEARRR
jgi:2-polyprenyl-3-methyl-5-hydroxy-6-metoxy-1,4-benzoquinol methylase